MKLVITIDTEEDNWGIYSQFGATLKNIERIPELQALFDEFGAIPTYLITYPVATDPKAQSILNDIRRKGRCEIGAHCHPWNTPPFTEICSVKNSWLCNLPSVLQLNKVRALTKMIAETFGVRPYSFRAGRWGFSVTVGEHLAALGYKVDTSITPYLDWTRDHGPNFTQYSPLPFQLGVRNRIGEDFPVNVIEIPASIGYLQANANLSHKIYDFAKRPFPEFLRLPGILAKLGLVNKIWLTPELCNSVSMIRLAEVMMRRGLPIMNLSFHSTTLVAGLTPFVSTSADERKFLTGIKDFLRYAKDSGCEFHTLSTAADALTFPANDLAFE
ncbi:MAG: hypothetical protein P0119_06100 [Nitrospira sp.]|nr:hypothetical protein [Nitrospira sp.]